MKKLIALVLALALTGTLFAAAAAEGTEEEVSIPKVINVAPFESSPEYFRIDVSDDGETAFIQTVAEADSRAFATPYESNLYYSAVFPELMIENWPREDERTAQLRIWIRYRGSKALNINAVSVIMGGSDFRFVDVTEAEWSATKDDGTAAQDAVIVLGSNPGNATCFAYLLAMAIEYGQNLASDPKSPAPEVTLVLHGDEDVEVTLPAGFWTELGMFAFNLDAVQGFPFLTRTTGTPCFVKEQ